MPQYCDNTDVKRILQIEIPFSSTSIPSVEDIDGFIQEAEDEIDNLTQHAWRTRTSRPEFYDFPVNNRRQENNGIPIYLRHRNVFTPRTSTVATFPDRIEVWDGTQWDNWLATHTEGRQNSWWIDNEQGVLYIKHFFPYYRKRALRMIYRYGETARPDGNTSIPKDIEKATAMMASIMVLESDDRSAVMSETGDPTRLSYQQRIERMQKEIDRIIRNRSSISSI